MLRRKIQRYKRRGIVSEEKEEKEEKKEEEERETHTRTNASKRKKPLQTVAAACGPHVRIGIHPPQC